MNLIGLFSQKRLLLIFIFFVIFNFLFSFSYWKQIFVDKTDYAVMGNDIDMAEFNMENNFQQVLKKENPFILKEKYLFPFSINLAMNDPGTSNLLFYAPLRLILNPNQAVLGVALISIILSNFLMFLLLNKMNINTPISLLISLIYGYGSIPSFMHLGHYTYTAVYIFPLMFLLFVYWKDSRQWKSLLLSLIIGFILGFVFLLNFYYFISIILSLGLGIFIAAISNRFNLILFKKSIKLFIISASIFIIILFPWLLAMIDYLSLKSLANPTVELGSIVTLSADLLDFITPAKSNPVFNYLFKNPADFNTHVYLGAITLSSFLYLFLRWRRLNLLFKKKIKPFICGVFFFGILLLGPFLKFANHWFTSLDGITVFIPMPFIIFHYLPGLGSLRAPTRFFPIFLFFSLIVVAYTLNEVLKKNNLNRFRLIIVGLFFVFLVDQFTLPPKVLRHEMPFEIYDLIKTNPEKIVVLEIPFTVRDGFRYIGDVNSISFMNGALIYDKPVIGGYFSRINQNIFEYYQNLSFIGYVIQIIDKDSFGTKFNQKKSNLKTPTVKEINTEINSLNIGYVILRMNESYSKELDQLLISSGARIEMIDGSFALYNVE